MTKHIATHKGMMHADEITAVALLRLFTNDEIIVHRIEHDTTDFSAYDMVIDISKTFDGVKYFDHHQHKGGKSSAGLIWDYLSLEDTYPNISKFINVVDNNDTGVKRANSTFFKAIRGANDPEIDPKLQDNNFNVAVEYVIEVLRSLKNDSDLQYMEVAYHHFQKLVLDLGECKSIFTQIWKLNFQNKKLEKELKIKREAAIKKASLWEENGLKYIQFKEGNVFVPSANLIGIADVYVQHDSQQLCWTVGTVPIKKGEFGSNAKLSSTGRDSEKFCHKAGFVGKYLPEPYHAINYPIVSDAIISIVNGKKKIFFIGEEYFD